MINYVYDLAVERYEYVLIHLTVCHTWTVSLTSIHFTPSHTLLPPFAWPLPFCSVLPPPLPEPTYSYILSFILSIYRLLFLQHLTKEEKHTLQLSRFKINNRNIFLKLQMIRHWILSRVLYTGYSFRLKYTGFCARFHILDTLLGFIYWILC